MSEQIENGIPSGSAAASSEAAAVPSRTPLPDFADIIFLIIVLLLVNVLPYYVLGDGSTGWHLYTGKYILTHGQVPHTDLLSYSFPNKPWVAYEWLFDTGLAFVNAIGGIKLVAVATICALAALFSMIYHACRKEQCHFLLAVLFTILGTLASTIHWLARPHLVTFFGVFIFSRTLERFRRGEISARRALITLPLTMLFWANAHPGFLIGLALIVIYAAGETLTALLSGDPDSQSAARKRALLIAQMLGLCVVASLVNANAAHLYSYIFEYLGNTQVLAQTDEFMQPNFKQLHAVCMLLLAGAFVVGLMVTRRRLGLSPLMAVLAFFWLAINGMRNEPLFVIVSVPIIAWLWGDCDLGALCGKADMPLAAWLKKPAALWQHIGWTVDAVESSCNMHLIPILTTVVLVIACLNNGKLFGCEIVISDFDPNSKPSTTLDAMMKLPEKSGMNLDNWGGYIVYKTGRRVFIDDRLDFYGPKYFMDYGALVGLQPQWQDILSKHKINWVLMPKKASLVGALRASPDWQVQAEDKAAVLMTRKQAP